MLNERLCSKSNQRLKAQSQSAITLIVNVENASLSVRGRFVCKLLTLYHFILYDSHDRPIL